MAASIQILELPSLPERGDISDWLDVGHTAEELAGLVDISPLFTLETLSSEYLGVADERDVPAAPVNKWKTAVEAQALKEMGWHFAKGGSQLYHYTGGSYKPAKTAYRRFMIDYMGHGWDQRRVDELFNYLYDSAPELWERPPLDRINVSNDLLEVGTGVLQPHESGFLSSVQIPVTFDPSADCPAITKFITEVFPRDIIALGFELAGWLLTPDDVWQFAVIFLGSGNNGKSTYLNLLAAFLGWDNVASVDLQDINDNQFAAAGLYGKLVNLAGDLSQKGMKSSRRFKSIVGGDSIVAERKYADSFRFHPFARMLFATNEAPTTPDGTHGYFRRWLPILFERRFEGANLDRNKLPRLTTPEELSGFLNMALVAFDGVKV